MTRAEIHTCSRLYRRALVRRKQCYRSSGEMHLHPSPISQELVSIVATPSNISGELHRVKLRGRARQKTASEGGEQRKTAHSRVCGDSTSGCTTLTLSGAS